MKYTHIAVLSFLMAWGVAFEASANPCAPAGSSLSAAERARMDAADQIRRSQEYLAKENLRIRNPQSGAGIASGLTVYYGNPPRSVVIQPGYALDSKGYLIRLN